MSSVSVEEGEAGVRVQAEAPHLVSLGSGRLSIAVTIHPLPSGTTVLGSGKHVDIVVNGLGVDEQHCYIENNRGILTLHSKSPRTTIDGLPVTQPTRLSQGSIIGLGHSSYFRFNHPDQARLMKKTLPDPKNSMLPLTFYQGACVEMDGNSPYHHQESRSRDTCSGINNFVKMSPKNGEIMNGELSPSNWRPNVSSPSHNKDSTPFTPFKPPPHSSSPSHNKQNKSDKNAKNCDIEELDLDEILAICSEYQRENQIERSTKPVQNRIKTNGSLPREKRLNSPTSPTHQHSFSFDTSDLMYGGEKDRSKDNKKSLHTYENVTFVPGSPRPRIKTFLNKDSSPTNVSNPPDGHGGNRSGLHLNLEPVILRNKSSSSTFNELSEQNQSISSMTSNLDGVKERDRASGEYQDKGRPPSIADMTAEKKYNFLGFDPRKDTPPDQTPQKDTTDHRSGNFTPSQIPQSPPSWTNPTLNCENFPDYDIVNGADDEDCKSSKRLSNQLSTGTTRSSISAIESLKMERETLLKNLSSLKEKITELEQQEEELIRESAIEEALVSGEIAAQDEKLKHEESRVAILKEKAKECDIEMEKCLQRQAQGQENFQVISERHMAMIDILENKLSTCENEELKIHLKEALKEQQELLDSERKNHEVLEFQLVEEEASWLSKREDIQKDLDEAMERLALRKEKVLNLHSSQNITNELEIQKLSHLKAIEEGRSRLLMINDELETLSKSYPSADSLISSSSDNKVVRRRVTSQDDLDRISKITSGAPIDMGSSNSLGRRTIASLKEIERNRQLHLINQGSLVIEEERQRVEELKRQVQDEVKAQWEQQRNSNCQSLTSITSDDSSLEPTRDSGVSSEEVEKNMMFPDDNKNRDSSETPVDNNLISETPESRPTSDVSGYSDDQLTVKIRSKSTSNLQRPLTRYLPIKSESLDLRAHIESAGHQVDLCSHVQLDSLSCRGYLSKIGSRFKTLARRWFVFDRAARTLLYFSDSSEKKRRGGVHFQDIEEVYVDHLNTFKSPNSKVTFVVKSTTRSYHLIAPSPEAMRIWVDVIFTGAEGYQQYPH
ncbi:unnamed protein product [Nezara viridula]|uniref:PH domain-containing protein n=1 Tax=Nezara viridula TaxID=85310 RepID=A0A9P0H8Q1_NEZVI|nr:unnamed protein product [Nezara viridula]